MSSRQASSLDGEENDPIGPLNPDKVGGVLRDGSYGHRDGGRFVVGAWHVSPELSDDDGVDHGKRYQAVTPIGSRRSASLLCDRKSLGPDASLHRRKAFPAIRDAKDRSFCRVNEWYLPRLVVRSDVRSIHWPAAVNGVKTILRNLSKLPEQRKSER